MISKCSSILHAVSVLLVYIQSGLASDDVSVHKIDGRNSQAVNEEICAWRSTDPHDSLRADSSPLMHHCLDACVTCSLDSAIRDDNSGMTAHCLEQDRPMTGI